MSQPEIEPQPESQPPVEPQPEITPTAKPRGRRRLLVAIIAIIVIVAVVAVAVIFITGTGSLLVSTSATVVDAGSSIPLQAVVNTPLLVTPGSVAWNFGDGSTSTSSSLSTTHVFYPGVFLIYATTTLSNGKVVDNSASLQRIQVVQPTQTNPNPLGSTAAYGLLVINTTASSSGAPLIASGGHIAFSADIQQAPTFSWNNEFDVANNSWANYTWQITSIVISYGDGTTNQSYSTTDPFNSPISTPILLDHPYSKTGLLALTVSVKTQNYTAIQYNGTPATPTPTPVSGSTITTIVGQTIAVGSWAVPALTLQNPGTIINMEAEAGGYFTLDPALDYESVGFEIIANVYETLLAYNGTSTSNFVPVVADTIPTVQNGGVSPDYLNYTFHIRSGLVFANGDPVTPWDVKYSITRTMLFDAGSPFPPGWIVSQFLVPGTFTPAVNATLFAILNNAITVDNATSTVTFHLQVAAPPLLFYQVVSDPLGAGIVDHKWLEANGPALVWTPAGFNAYEAYSFESSYINAWRNSAMGSGPFVIKYESNPNSVVLEPNPKFTPLPGVAAADSSVKQVILEYVPSDSSRVLALRTGQADIGTILPDHFYEAKDLASQGLVDTYFFPTLNMFWANFNFDVYYQGGKNTYGNTIPANFFVDQNVRKAFFHAFNFTQYISSFLGNGVYGVNFGQTWNGIIPQGMIGYQNLSYYNVFDMTLAKQEYQASAWYKAHPTTPISIAINVESADTVDQAAALAWATNIESLDPGVITVTMVPTPFADLIANSVAWGDPMAIYFLGWLPDYPFPTDYTLPMLLPNAGVVGNASLANGGTYPNANNWDIPLFKADPNGTNQVANMTLIYNWIIDSITTNSTNTPAIVDDSQKAQLMAANLTIYVPSYQQYSYFVYKPWIGGMLKEINPTLGGADLLYDLLTKSTGASAASVGATSSLLASGLASVVPFLVPLTTIQLFGAAARVESWRRER